MESVDLRSAIRKADAVLPAFAREGQRGHTVKRVARRGRCRLLFLLGVQHIAMVGPRVTCLFHSNVPAALRCSVAVGLGDLGTRYYNTT